MDFNTLVDEMLLEREHLYTTMGIRRIGHSTRHLDPAAKFIFWFDVYKLGGHEDDDVDNIIEDPDNVPTK